MVALDAAAARAWIDAFAAAAESRLDELNELDRQSGDGDFGTNLRGALARIRAEEATDVGAVFAAAAAAFMGAGGTSGPLVGAFFRALARASAGRAELAVDELAAGAAAGLDAIRRLGGAAPGDKTMVDALEPAVQALVTGGGLADAARAARAGAEATADLVARRGRASYVGEAARGVVDPGALTIALFFEAAPGAD